MSHSSSGVPTLGDIDTQPFVAWVRAAAPYIHAFRGKTFVVGFGGEVVAGEMAQKLAYDCNLLAALGIRLVLVHGARPQIDAEMQRRGLVSRFHNGLRVTDVAALECVKSAMAVTRLFFRKVCPTRRWPVATCA